MKLATLLRRSGTADESTADDTNRAVLRPEDDDAAMRREWDHLRDSAGSDAERTEIDAFFSRAMP